MGVHTLGHPFQNPFFNCYFLSRIGLPVTRDNHVPISVYESSTSLSRVLPDVVTNLPRRNLYRLFHLLTFVSTRFFNNVKEVDVESFLSKCSVFTEWTIHEVTFSIKKRKYSRFLRIRQDNEMVRNSFMCEKDRTPYRLAQELLHFKFLLVISVHCRKIP